MIRAKLLLLKVKPPGAWKDKVEVSPDWDSLSEQQSEPGPFSSFNQFLAGLLPAFAVDEQTCRLAQ
jgi:hypothetical protein